MAECMVVFWRAIPAQVIVREKRTTARRELPKRFIEAIDRAAMKAGLTGTDGYLEQWRRGPPEPCGDDLDTVANEAAARLEIEYPPDRLRRLSEAGGVEA